MIITAGRPGEQPAGQSHGRDSRHAHRSASRNAPPAGGRGWPRLAVVLALTAAAFGALAAGATGGVLPGGTLAMLRNLGGITGIGLPSAAALGGAFAWTGPMGYLLITEVGLAGHPTTPWLWTARPPHDRGAAISAVLVFTVGAAVITLRGSRDCAAE